MGSWTELYINRKVVYGSKNYIEVGFSEMIFRKSDNYKVERKISERINFEVEDSEDPNELETAYFFKSTIEKVINRLEILGYTLKSLENNFNEFKNLQIEEAKSSVSIFESTENYKKVEKVIEFTKAEIKFWKKTSLEDFLVATKDIIINNEQYKISFDKSLEDFSSAKNYLLAEHEYLLHRLPFTDYFRSLRAILEGLPKDWEVIQDYTDLIAGGYLEEDFIVDEIEEKIIVLTEGVSDINILKPSLKLLFPHLSDYYSFIDFKTFKAQGSTSGLITIIKAFAGAGIRNKVIAIFDNDTAAREAQTVIDDMQIPWNIKVLNYPNLALAEDYPTIGPSGLNKMNINGLACSIELYTGEDILRDINNQLTPIQWMGYSTKMKNYQGEILNKIEIQQKFDKKLKEAQLNPALIEMKDWEGIKQILNLIFKAFE